jgi:hypothetical protein
MRMTDKLSDLPIYYSIIYCTSHLWCVNSVCSRFLECYETAGPRRTAVEDNNEEEI